MVKVRRRFFKNIYRYFLFLLAIVLKWFIRYMPRRAVLVLGRIGGDIGFVLLRRERNRAISNIQMALGEDINGYNIAKGLFRHLGMNLVEWLKLPSLNREVINRIIKVVNLERINKALERGKGVIILTAHLGNWEYLAAYLTLNGYKGSVVARRIYYPLYNKLLLHLRESVGIKTLWRNGSVRDMIKVLKQNNLLGILPDQDTDKVDGVFIDFFGRPAYTPIGPVNLALATGAIIVPCFIVREGIYHRIYVETPLEMVNADTKEETIRINTERWSKIVEEYIKMYPQQWVWIHRRWNTKNQVLKEGMYK